MIFKKRKPAPDAPQADPATAGEPTPEHAAAPAPSGDTGLFFRRMLGRGRTSAPKAPLSEASSPDAVTPNGAPRRRILRDSDGDGPPPTSTFPRVENRPPSPDSTQPRRRPAPGQIPPAELRRRRLREQERITRLPRRAARFGFGPLGWLLGFFGLIFRMLLVTLLVIGISAYLGYQIVNMYIMTPEVVVPNVRGMKLDAAVEIVSDKGLSLVKDRAEATGLVAPGEIIDQRPQPGSTTKSGAALHVVVASGRSRFVVPDVIRETRENAANKIRGANLEVGDITLIEDDKFPKDTVIKQSPEAGKGMDQAGKVNLLVSSGGKGTGLTMPDLSGRAVGEAKAALEGMGILDVALDPPTGGSGRVVSHDPPVGRSVLPTQKVTLKTAP